MPVIYPLDCAQLVGYCLHMARPHLTEEGYIKSFWSGVDKTSECWNWTRSKMHFGHGQFHYKGKRVFAHRFSWMLHVGAIPEGAMICHKCNNPSCVRPDHLYAGNAKTNGADKAAAGSHKGRKNAACKLTEAQVLEIRAALAAGVCRKELAVQYAISAPTISAINTGYNWGWL